MSSSSREGIPQTEQQPYCVKCYIAMLGGGSVATLSVSNGTLKRRGSRLVVNYAQKGFFCVWPAMPQAPSHVVVLI